LSSVSGSIGQILAGLWVIDTQTLVMLTYNN
jgi:hypothetical protein